MTESVKLSELLQGVEYKHRSDMQKIKDTVMPTEFDYERKQPASIDEMSRFLTKPHTIVVEYNTAAFEKWCKRNGLDK